MMNEHDYEIVYTPELTEETKKLGIIRVEITQCRKCGYENTFVCTEDACAFLFKEEPCNKAT